jgi:NAD(P)-dependent dehydrogenase (short-subunit alcohol dehydrogenase family)
LRPFPPGSPYRTEKDSGTPTATARQETDVVRVKNSVVVITGASSGIGHAAALRFASKGAAVVLAARREQPLHELAQECRGKGVEALVGPTDVTDAKAVEELARRAAERFGRIDVWVNNAAVTFFAPFLEAPLEDFRRLLDVNVMGYVHGARAALPYLREQGSGVIINVSSIVGVVAQPYTSAYSMSKAAIRVLSTSLRSELWLDGYRGVRVCTVLPATIDTPLFRHTGNYTGREVVPMPPVYTPQRVARTIVNLARMPRREIVVGSMGRLVALQYKTNPGLVERNMAHQVDKTHLSRERPAPNTSGNLYEPSTDPRNTSVEGGWGGRRRTAQRRMLLAGLAGGAATAAVRQLVR